MFLIIRYLEMGRGYLIIMWGGHKFDGRTKSSIKQMLLDTETIFFLYSISFKIKCWSMLSPLESGYGVKQTTKLNVQMNTIRDNILQRI